MGIPRRDEQRTFHIGSFPLLVRPEVVERRMCRRRQYLDDGRIYSSQRLREFVAACDAAFWLAKFVVAAGGDWPRLPFCCRGIFSAFAFFFSPLFSSRAWRFLCVSAIFAARASEEAPNACCARGVLCAMRRGLAR